ncbi:MAG: SPOR domain-containing protein [Gammaproteobacteria bacterium]
MKISSVTSAVVVSVLAMAFITGCSRERLDWKSAESADTLEAYDHFVERHPDSPLATQARARMTQLVEDKDWQHANSVDTAEAYKAFLAQHASGKWAEEARIRVENFTLETNPSPLATPSSDTEPSAPPRTAKPGTSPSADTPSSGTAQPGELASREAGPRPAPATPPSKPSQLPAHAESNSGTAKVAPSPAAAPARPAAAPSAANALPPVASSTADPPAGFGIQLGAFSTQAAALAAWKRLQVNYDGELHGMFAHAVPVQVASGQLFRLQSPVGEEARARGICAALAKRSQPCVVVLPQVK